VLWGNWQTLSIEKTLDRLKTHEAGLSAAEASRRLLEYGPNKLPEVKGDGIVTIFFRQFRSSLIYLLLVASAIVYFVGETSDSLIILAILFFNAIVGTIQEGRAENTLRALRNFVETTATVVRDGEEIVVPDSEVVPGDIIILQEGEKVPADARVLISQNLRADEAALTGESVSVHKSPEPSAEEGADDARTMVFKGTNIVAGNGKAVVIATGSLTGIGKIATEITSIKSEIPLQKNIRALSRVVIAAVLVVAGTLFFVGVYAGNDITTMFTAAVAITVSVIPEGLPIVMTLVLASGVWRMSKRHALVKKLQAVEALGQARVIAVDKTGTITKNEMVVQSVYVDGKTFDVEGVGYEPKGAVRQDGAFVRLNEAPELLKLGTIAALSPSAHVMYAEETKEWKVSGDPTEAAVVVLSHKLGFKRDEMEQTSPLIAELPFDYRLKYRANLHSLAGKQMLSVVGAPEVILERASKIWHGGEDLPLSHDEKRKLETVFLEMSRKGLRVVALAERAIVKKEGLVTEDVEHLVFVGFLGMKDALRPEVEDAMKRAREAGIKVVMITGDHMVTAEAIAREAGIYRGGGVLTGKEIDGLSDEGLAEKLDSISVFARVTPEHKLRIITAYKARGEVIAMTGDGVNDAPSLVAADLGVSMGRIGTEVAKEASDIVLLDDNFGSIISAIEEGRRIYRSMKRVILYLFSTGAGEVLTIAGALFSGLPLPVLPAQIIWLNFVTDGFLDMALAMEPKGKGLLSGKFANPGKYFVDTLMAQRMILMAVPMALGALFVFTQYYEADMAKALTMSMTVLAIFQWFNAWNCRSQNESIFTTNPFSNLYLLGATTVVIALQIAAVYTPFMQNILHTVPLTLSEWLLVSAIATSIIFVEEVRKFIFRRWSTNQPASL